MKFKSEIVKIKEYLLKRSRDRYKFIILNEDTLEQKFTFQLSRTRIFTILGIASILLVLVTTYIIAFTSLKYYIPGYSDPSLQHKVYETYMRTDSLENIIVAQDLQLQNIKMILTGEIVEDTIGSGATDTSITNKYKEITDNTIIEDSLLRAEYEVQSRFNLFSIDKNLASYKPKENLFLNFYSPVKGVATSDFDPIKKHFGIDIVTKPDETVKSIQNGIIIFAGWTVETGNVIIIKHPENVISVYKHNAVLLKKEGNVVKTGESIAIVGNSGDYTTGPHLHFELWINETPVNPKDYIVF